MIQTAKVTMSSVSLEKHIESRLQALEKAVDIAARVMEKRLDGMNEFRMALKDQNHSFVTKDQFELFRTSVGEDIRLLREFRAVVDSKASQSALHFSYLLSAIGLLMGVASLIINLVRG